MIIHIFLLIILLLLPLLGCKPDEPITTNTNSSAYATLSERIAFLHQYVTFRRTYETLDFDIMYQNNGGGLIPGSSDWDIRLIATVPESEFQSWVPRVVKSSALHNTAWLTSIPTTINLSGVKEWYVDGGRVVGLNRKDRIIVYRTYSH